ncbi:MAG: hypothetical protein QM695_16400 [Micropruina sp.]
MTWTRLDDLWTEQKEITDLSFEARWHYLCLIQACSRSMRTDGVIREVDALRCSDVEEPRAAMNEIYKAGLIQVATGDNGKKTVKLLRVDDHLPSASTIAKTEADRIRQQRSRKHKSGDHSMCYRQRCDQGVLDEPTPSRVTSHVTENKQIEQDSDKQMNGRCSDPDCDQPLTNPMSRKAGKCPAHMRRAA